LKKEDVQQIHYQISANGNTNNSINFVDNNQLVSPSSSVSFKRNLNDDHVGEHVGEDMDARYNMFDLSDKDNHQEAPSLMKDNSFKKRSTPRSKAKTPNNNNFGNQDEQYQYQNASSRSHTPNESPFHSPTQTGKFSATKTFQNNDSDNDGDNQGDFNTTKMNFSSEFPMIESQHENEIAKKRASSAIAQRASVHFPDMTPQAHGTAIASTRANDSAPWQYGQHGSIPGGDFVELGTWAETNTIKDLEGLGTGLGLGLAHGKEKNTHLDSRSSARESIGLGQRQRKALEAHRINSFEAANAGLIAAQEASSWRDPMIAAAAKAVMDDNEEALRRIACCCAESSPTNESSPLNQRSSIDGSFEEMSGIMNQNTSLPKSQGNGVVSRHRNADGSTLLHLACLHGSYRCAAALIDLGAAVAATAMNGDTPFHSACYHGHVSCLRVLVAASKHTAALALRQYDEKKKELELQNNPKSGSLNHRSTHKSSSHLQEPFSPFPYEPYTPLNQTLTKNLTSGKDQSSNIPREQRNMKNPSKTSIAACGGSKELARAVLSLLERENGSGHRAVDVLSIRLKAVGGFEKWPQINHDPKLSVLKQFKLALGWFDENWGIQIKENIVVDVTLDDPVLAYLHEAPFKTHRTKFTATPETRQLARQVVIGKAIASETQIYQGGSLSSSSNQHHRNHRQSSRGGVGGGNDDHSRSSSRSSSRSQRNRTSSFSGDFDKGLLTQQRKSVKMDQDRLSPDQIQNGGGAGGGGPSGMMRRKSSISTPTKSGMRRSILVNSGRASILGKPRASKVKKVNGKRSQTFVVFAEPIVSDED